MVGLVALANSAWTFGASIAGWVIDVEIEAGLLAARITRQDRRARREGRAHRRDAGQGRRQARADRAEAGRAVGADDARRPLVAGPARLGPPLRQPGAATAHADARRASTCTSSLHGADDLMHLEPGQDPRSRPRKNAGEVAVDPSAEHLDKLAERAHRRRAARVPSTRPRTSVRRRRRGPLSAAVALCDPGARDVRAAAGVRTVDIARWQRQQLALGALRPDPCSASAASIAAIAGLTTDDAAAERVVVGVLGAGLPGGRSRACTPGCSAPRRRRWLDVDGARHHAPRPPGPAPGTWAGPRSGRSTLVRTRAARRHLADLSPGRRTSTSTFPRHYLRLALDPADRAPPRARGRRGGRAGARAAAPRSTSPSISVSRPARPEALLAICSARACSRRTSCACAKAERVSALEPDPLQVVRAPPRRSPATRGQLGAVRAGRGRRRRR